MSFVSRKRIALLPERSEKQNSTHPMIPYFQMPALNLFGLSIHAFEVITSVGIYFGIRYALWMARKRNLSEKIMMDAIMISIVVGFFGAHATHVLLYQKDFTHLARLLQLWQGISSTGGFLTGGLAAWLYLRKKKQPILNFGDCMVPAVLIALFFGRIGCFTVHDHPGNLTTLPWGVQFPGGTRHDLGLEEAIIVGLFLIITRSKQILAQLNEQKGNWMIAGMMFYGCIRAALDHMRAEDLPTSDARYFGHTPAQYICAGFVILSVFLLKKRDG